MSDSRELKRLQEFSEAATRRGKVFRVHALGNELSMVGRRQPEDLGATRRHKLLQLRAHKPEDFKDPIPLVDYEIALNPKWRSLLPDTKPVQTEGVLDEEDPDEADVGNHKAKALAALKNFALQAQKKAHGWTRKHRVALKDVLEEGQLYDFQNISLEDMKKVRYRMPLRRCCDCRMHCWGGAHRLWCVHYVVTQLVEPRRKLRPRRRKKQVLSGDAEGDKVCSFFVKVVRAVNVPVRRAEADMRATLADTNYHPHHHHHHKDTEADVVRSYVEVRFKNSVPVRTTSVEGAAPRWDESIRIPFRPPHNDTSPKNLLSVHESLQVSLFDERRRVVTGECAVARDSALCEEWFA